MGMSGISKSQVSRLCQDIDQRVGRFLERPLRGQWPYLWLDATYLEVAPGWPRGKSGKGGRRGGQRRGPPRGAWHRVWAGRDRGVLAGVRALPGRSRAPGAACQPMGSVPRCARASNGTAAACSAAALACAVMAAPSAALRHSSAATWMVLVLVLVLAATVTAAAMAKISSATRRMYQPAMRSMASSNLPASRSCSRSEASSARRSALPARP